MQKTEAGGLARWRDVVTPRGLRKAWAPGAWVVGCSREGGGGGNRLRW